MVKWQVFLLFTSDQTNCINPPEGLFKEEVEEDGEPPAKRHARGTVPQLTNSIASAPDSSVPNGARSPELRSLRNLALGGGERGGKLERDRPEKVFTPFQSHWRWSFHGLKFLRRGMGEAITPRWSTVPAPIDVISRVFPEHKRYVLELILKGCEGNLVQAIDSILVSDCVSQKEATSSSGTSSEPSIPTMHFNSTFPGIPSEAAYPGVPIATRSLMRMMQPLCFRPVYCRVPHSAPQPNMAIFTQPGAPVTSAGFKRQSDHVMKPLRGVIRNEMQFPPIPASKSSARQGH